MTLLERTESLEQLQSCFHRVLAGHGNSVFIEGEAGIGKTALVRKFLADISLPYLLLEGYCDSLFAARPLGPLFDIAPGLGEEFAQFLKENPHRSQIFSSCLEALSNQTKPVILFFEDIHWADEATLDLIRFLARRIRQVPCLFLLTLRDNELPAGHPYRMILGELPPTDFQKLILTPLSRSTVDKLAEEAGRNGDEIFSLTAGVPYYVTELLADYHRGIPETVRDSILSLYHRQFDATKELWESVSIIPGRIELELIRKIQGPISRVVDFCFRAGIIIDDGYAISFKHELFRSTIEQSLTPSRQRELHKIVMDAMLAVTEFDVPTARIIHHARLAHDVHQLRTLAPKAAREASELGSHLEASKFYQLALEHSGNIPHDALAELNEKYSYECYLTNQIPEAIQALEMAVLHWPDENRQRKGNAFRFMSRLHWFAGNLGQATALGLKAVEWCNAMSASYELAMAYSNMAQLMMLSDNHAACLDWGEKAVALAHKLEDREVLCHIYNTMGYARMQHPDTFLQGEEQLRESLMIAHELQNHEHVARAYTNLGHAYLEMKNYDAAKQSLGDGIVYCDERDLHSWMHLMQGGMAQLFLETGRWQQAEVLCRLLLQNPRQQKLVLITLKSVLATLHMRRGEVDVDAELASLIEQVSHVGQLKRLSRITNLVLEYAWLTDTEIAYPQVVRDCISQILDSQNTYYLHEISVWLWKTDGMSPEVYLAGGTTEKASKEDTLDALVLIKQGDPYLEAVFLAEGDADDQRQALLQLKAMGAVKTVERVQALMRTQGITNIPRGPRTSTLENSAGLTQRQMDVLVLLSKGLQNKEIADQLFLSVKTVDHHISAILSKLDVHSRAKAVTKARKTGIIK